MNPFFSSPTDDAAGADRSTYELVDGATAPKGGLSRVRVSKRTASRVYFHDADAVRATETVNFSLPADEFDESYNLQAS